MQVLTHSSAWNLAAVTKPNPGNVESSSHQAAGRYSPGDAQPGWWGGLIGPGKTIDTNRYFVVSSNMLGSSYGSTASSSVNPLSG